MALTDVMVDEVVRRRLKGTVLDTVCNEWWEQEDGQGWDFTIYVDGDKFTKEFGGTGDEVMAVRIALTDWIEEEYPGEEDAGFYTFDIFFDDEEEERYA